jgi:hypothetical protein
MLGGVPVPTAWHVLGLRMEDLDTEVEINSAWETIRESLGYFELKKHKPW